MDVIKTLVRRPSSERLQPHLRSRTFLDDKRTREAIMMKSTLVVDVHLVSPCLVARSPSPDQTTTPRHHAGRVRSTNAPIIVRRTAFHPSRCVLACSEQRAASPPRPTAHSPCRRRRRRLRRRLHPRFHPSPSTNYPALRQATPTRQGQTSGTRYPSTPARSCSKQLRL